MEANNFSGQTKKNTNLGTVGMIIGIVALVLSCLIIGGLVGIVGFILSIMAISSKETPKGKAVAGIILNSIALIIAGGMILIAVFSPAETKEENNSVMVTENTQKPQEANDKKKSDDKSKEKEKPKKTPKPTPKPQKDIFIEKIMAKSNMSKKMANKLYMTLKNKCGFKNITYDSKVSENLILHDLKCDDYKVRISADKNGIYLISCGDYELYKKGKVKYTKKDLKKREIGNNNINYYVMAQQAVKNGLKSPSSAKFPSVSNVSMQRNGKYVAIHGYVDADNSFGASIRSEYLVEIKVKDVDNLIYDLVFLQIDGRKMYGKYKKLN